MGYPAIYVLRHGETHWNAEGRLQGTSNSPLTEAGRAQAARQGALLEALDLSAFDIRISPQGRAIETAGIALAHQADFLRTDDRLREIDVGGWTGAVRHMLEAAHVTPSDHTPDGHLAIYDAAPGGEGFDALRTRCLLFLESLTRPTICVTHGITSRMLRATAMGQPGAALGDLPGGQGVVHVVEDRRHRTLG